MSDWGRESADLFRNARGVLSPRTANRDRVRARVAAKIGSSAIVGALATTTSKVAASTSAAKTAAVSLAAKIVTPIVLLAGASAMAVPRMLAPREHVAIAVVAPLSVGVAACRIVDAPKALPSIDVSELPTARPSELRAVPRARNSPPSAEEAALVADLDAALRSGDTPLAARLLSDHERRFPAGLLVEEREGARVLAQCMNGARSPAGANAFFAAHPRSPMRARIVAACGMDDTPL